MFPFMIREYEDLQREKKMPKPDSEYYKKCPKPEEPGNASVQ